jgi:cellulose biosynthesis protein BcsQ
MVEKRKSMHREIIENCGSQPDFLKSSVPYNAEVERMGIYRAPLNAVRPASTAANAYSQLWKEITDALLP